MVGGSILATPFNSTLPSLVSILGGFGTSLVFLAFGLLAFEFTALTLFDVAFVLLLTTFATELEGDGAPEVVLMVHCFSIFIVLLPV